MKDFFDRQIKNLRQTIDDYRAGRLTLNTLIQRIQGIGDVLEDDEWKQAVFPIIWSMEQINAFALEEKQDLTEKETRSIENSLLELEAFIGRLDAE